MQINNQTSKHSIFTYTKTYIHTQISQTLLACVSRFMSQPCHTTTHTSELTSVFTFHRCCCTVMKHFPIMSFHLCGIVLHASFCLANLGWYSLMNTYIHFQTLWQCTVDVTVRYHEAHNLHGKLIFIQAEKIWFELSSKAAWNPIFSDQIQTTLVGGLKVQLSTTTQIEFQVFFSLLFRQSPCYTVTSHFNMKNMNRKQEEELSRYWGISQGPL